MAKLCAIRARKMRAQSGRCYYCGTPMWSWNPGRFRKRFRLQWRTVHRYQCTAEHLLARRDGGTDAVDNIVAACRFCNEERHNAKRVQDPAAYRNRVRARVASGTWKTVQTRKSPPLQRKRKKKRRLRVRKKT